MKKVGFLFLVISLFCISFITTSNAEEINDSGFLAPQMAFPYLVFLEEGTHFISILATGGIQGVAVFRKDSFPSGDPVYVISGSGTGYFSIPTGGEYIILVPSGETEGGTYTLVVK